MVRAFTKIEKVYKPISKKLWEEILYALDNLNKDEKKKTQGHKKYKYNQLEASHELGKYVHGLRKKN